MGRAAKARRLAVLAVAQGADGGGSGVASECTHGSPVEVEESVGSEACAAAVLLALGGVVAVPAPVPPYTIP